MQKFDKHIYKPYLSNEVYRKVKTVEKQVFQNMHLQFLLLKISLETLKIPKKYITGML